MTPDITVQWGLAIIVATLAAITILIAQMMADSRRLRQVPPEEDAAGMLHRRDEEARAAELERQLDGGEGHG